MNKNLFILLSRLQGQEKKALREALKMMDIDMLQLRADGYLIQKGKVVRCSKKYIFQRTSWIRGHKKEYIMGYLDNPYYRKVVHDPNWIWTKTYR